MSDVKIKFKFDTSELENATRQLVAMNGKDLSTALNKKMGWIHRRWLWNVKKADFQRIKNELGVELKSVVGKRGGVLKRKRLGFGDTYYNQLATLIIVSRYRKKGLSVPPKGKLKSEALKLVRSKIKSVNFLKSIIAQAGKPFFPAASGSGGPPKTQDEKIRPIGRTKGFGTLAKDGKKMVAVSVSKEWTKSRIDRKGRTSGGEAGGEKYLKPGLEKAYADETADTVIFLNKQLYDTARKLGVSANR